MKDILDIAFQRGVRVEFADLGSRNGEYADGVVTINHRRPEHVQRLILVGDPNQLPPIGVGRPFADLVTFLETTNVGADEPAP